VAIKNVNFEILYSNIPASYFCSGTRIDNNETPFFVIDQLAIGF